MNKKLLHVWLVRLKAFSGWWLLGATVFFVFVSVLALRMNNQRMIHLREQVFVADEKGGDVESALINLREYVYSHMNTDLTAGENAIHPPIQLKYRYERLVASEQSTQQTGSSDIYTEAQDYCEKTQPQGYSGSNRLPCIREYLDNHGVSTAKEVHIPEDMYKFDFESPAWSPDLAGISIVLAGLCLLLLAAKLATERIIKSQLNKHI